MSLMKTCIYICRSFVTVLGLGGLWRLTCKLHTSYTTDVYFIICSKRKSMALSWCILGTNKVVRLPRNSSRLSFPFRVLKTFWWTLQICSFEPPFYACGIFLWRDFLSSDCYFFNFEGWFRGLFQMCDQNGIYHEKADVLRIPNIRQPITLV